MNLLEFQERFPDEDACERYLIEQRWPEGFVCESCGSNEAWYLSARRSFQCCYCNRQRSITADTMFHRSRTSLREWFMAIYLVTESKKGISVLELAHHLGMRDPKRAARIKQRIQEAMTERNSRYLLEGFVELDEAVFGEAGRNTDVAVAVSLEEESGRPKYVRFQVLENMKAKTLESFAKNVAAKSCDVATDGHPSHNGFTGLFHEHIRCVQTTPLGCRRVLALGAYPYFQRQTLHPRHTPFGESPARLFGRIFMALQPPVLQPVSPDDSRLR